MPNKWVEFVKKWSAENNMNYMCAMTTKECKEAYLKEHPKPEKKVRAKKAKAEVAPPAPPAPDRSKVQMELVEMGQKAKDVAEKRANIQMELSEIGKKAKLKEAQKEAQKFLATKGMANKAKQMAVEKEQMAVEKEQMKAVPAPANGAEKSKSELIAELRGILSNRELEKPIDEIGKAKMKNTITSLAEKQGFRFSGGVFKDAGMWGQNDPPEMIENALTVLEKGKNEPRHSVFLTGLLDYVKRKIDKWKENEMANAEKETAKEMAKAERDKAKAERDKAKAEKYKANEKSDVARFQEAEANPALKVLTNTDLLKMIGSFTKGMKKPYTAVKGIRGKLRDDLLDFFRPIFQTPEYKIRYKGDPPPTDDVNDGEIDFLNAGGKFKWKDILNMVKLITLQTNKYTQKDFGYENRYTIGNMMIMLFHNKGVGDVLKVDKRSPTGLWKDTERVEIPIPMKIKDSKFRYDSFVLDPNA